MRATKRIGSAARCLFPGLLVLLATAASAEERVAAVRHQVTRQGIEVTYDLVGRGPYEVTLHVLRVDRPFQYKARSVSGDVGPDVEAGRERRIVWQALADLPELEGEGWVFEVRARRQISRTRYVIGGLAAAVLVGGAAVASGAGGASGPDPDVGTLVIEVPDPE